MDRMKQAIVQEEKAQVNKLHKSNTLMVGHQEDNLD